MNRHFFTASCGIRARLPSSIFKTFYLRSIGTPSGRRMQQSCKRLSFDCSSKLYCWSRLAFDCKSKSSSERNSARFYQSQTHKVQYIFHNRKIRNVFICLTRSKSTQKWTVRPMIDSHTGWSFATKCTRVSSFQDRSRSHIENY